MHFVVKVTMNRLFRSQTCFSILSYLYQHQERALYLRELAAGIKADPANVNRELKRLVKEGFVIKESKAKRPYYRIADHPAWAAFLPAVRQASGSGFIGDKAWTAVLELSHPNRFFARCWLHGFVSDEHQYRHESVYAAFHHDRMKLYMDQDAAKDIGERFAAQSSDAGQMESVRQAGAGTIRDLFEFAHLLPQEGASQLSPADVWKLYQRHEQLQRAVSVQAFVTIAADVAWRDAARRLAGDPETAHMLSLSGHPTVAEAEQESLLSLAAAIQADEQLAAKVTRWHEQRLAPHSWEIIGLDSHVFGMAAIPDLPAEQLRLMHEHHRRYGVAGYVSTGEIRPFDHVFADIARLVCHDQDCAATLRRIIGRRAERAERRAGLAARLNLTTEQAERFRLYGEWQHLKQERRLTQEYALYKMRPILETIAVRLSLSLAELDALLPQEIEASLLAKKPVDRASVNERLRSCIYVATADGGRYLVGSDAETCAAALAKPARRPYAVHLRGTTARRGFAAGRVRLVLTAEHAALVKAGEIVVAPLLRPGLVGVLPQAAAFVTEQGGITSHAAILARELGIPCVVSVKNAVSCLFDGQMAEVDADRGIIRASN